jgi:hypothetical protein
MSHRKVFGCIGIIGLVAALSAACSGDDDDGGATGGGAGSSGQGSGGSAGSPSGGGAGAGPSQGAGGAGGGAGSGGAGGGAGAGGAAGAAGAGGAGVDDTELAAADFDCILDWPKVRRFRITNKLGDVDASLAVANQPGSADYPPGTVIQLLPAEAMVKRRPGFSEATNDWEFLFLEPSAQGTTITARGTTEVVNGFGGNCFSCHSAAEPKYDLICEDGHGCAPLPFTPDQIETIQQSDPRCPPGGGRAR